MIILLVSNIVVRAKQFLHSNSSSLFRISVAPHPPPALPLAQIKSEQMPVVARLPFIKPLVWCSCLHVDQQVVSVSRAATFIYSWKRRRRRFLQAAISSKWQTEIPTNWEFQEIDSQAHLSLILLAFRIQNNFEFKIQSQVWSRTSLVPALKRQKQVSLCEL